MNKKTLHTLLGIFLFVFLCIVFFYFVHLMKSKKKDDIDNYFASFNIISKGVVIATDSLKETFYKPGLICLKVINSNYDIYDPRDSLQEYFLLQRDSLVVFYDSGDLRGNYFYEVGDIVIINGKEKKIKCSDKLGSLKFSKNISLRESFFCPYYQFSPFLKKCKEKQLLFPQ